MTYGNTAGAMPRGDETWDTSSHCPACGSGARTKTEGIFDTRFGSEGSFAVAECVGCGLWRTWPRPSAPNLEALYSRHYNFRATGRPKRRYDGLRERFLGSPLYKLWMRLDGDPCMHSLRGSGRLLDVGCNEGRGLELYRRNGFEAEGLETNRAAAAEARRKGFVVHERSLEAMRLEGAFEVVVMANVLEHTPNPLSALLAAKRALRPGGSLWLSVPNLESWARRIFARRWINWHVPFHLTHFSLWTLSALLQKAGLIVEKAGTITPSVWLAQSCIVAVAARPGRPTAALRSTLAVGLLSLLFRVFLFPLLSMANRMGKGDCLIVHARKPGSIERS